ncbi:DUF3375 domain-containing protein [Naumannella sp. ID2617S]|uniref:DUF3375 domain-containing protein n=1 Tax=Enemella dayhoffiae TaxID=2016507 RepID=A0A255HDL6_9ACTN|nr:DUF3375 domain-containing protein [Enemella dayhoffiae]NNG19879.1 DUF3375 domain-containing protein [Naumannella sp. ID2617S]OYO25123.1 hypothetical protein CGZ93_01305 [Enemella dayhoffiae]
MSASVPATAHAYARLRDESALTLLKGDNLAPTAAILASHFGGAHRVLPAAEFTASVDADLSLLRDSGFDLPQTAQEYLSEWVRRGHLVRRPGESREETVELSAGAAAALAFLDSLEAPRVAVTSSRFANVADLLSNLARDTDPDAATRLEALLAERDRLDAEIDRVERGEFDPLDPAAAHERLADILSLAGEISTDFSRVSADLETLNRDLKDRIIRSTSSRAEVLEEVFTGVDLIEDSPAGRTFRAFHAVVLDPERAESFDAAVASILDRPFARDVTPHQRFVLRELLTNLQQDAGTVRSTMTGLSRSLRQFVQTRSWQDHRRLEDAITAAQRAVLDALRTLSPLTGARHELTTTSIPLSSIGSWALHNPGDVRSTAALVRVPAGTVDLAALRHRVRESEIDFAELTGHVATSLATRTTATVGEVLIDHPATQGLASVIGLLSLAERHGTSTGGTEPLRWQSVSGSRRVALAPRHLFTTPPEEWDR